MLSSAPKAHVRRVRRELLLHNDHSKSIHGQKTPFNSHSERVQYKKQNCFVCISSRKHLQHDIGFLDDIKAEIANVAGLYSIGLTIEPEQLFINALWFDDTPKKHHRERKICITIDGSNTEKVIDRYIDISTDDSVIAL